MAIAKVVRFLLSWFVAHLLFPALPLLWFWCHHQKLCILMLCIERGLCACFILLSAPCHSLSLSLFGWHTLIFGKRRQFETFALQSVCWVHIELRPTVQCQSKSQRAQLFRQKGALNTSQRKDNKVWEDEEEERKKEREMAFSTFFSRNPVTFWMKCAKLDNNINYHWTKRIHVSIKWEYKRQIDGNCTEIRMNAHCTCNYHWCNY